MRLGGHDAVPDGWVAMARQTVTFEYETHGAVREAEVVVWYEFDESCYALDAVAFERYLRHRCADTSAEDLALEIATLLDAVCDGGVKVVLTADVGASERVTVEVRRGRR